MALSSLVLMLGLATGAGAQTCATTDVAITGVTPAPSDPAALAGDCATLLGLMDALRGTASLNWANSLSMASWDGITVTGSRVTGLVLISRQLTGTIPAALNSLTALQILAFFRNELSGEIPDLSSLTALEELLLADNELSGSIPDLSALTNLRQIELYQNRLSGSIPDLSALTNLNQIHLSENQLSGEIPDLSGLTELSNAQFQRNQLSGPIPDFSGLPKLGILRLNYNRLSGPIPALSSLPRLRTLVLDNNQLTGSIPDLTALTALTRLWLDLNQISGAIPTTLGSMSSLEELHLAGNPLTGGIPSQLGSLTSLTHLSLCGTDLDASATLPSALETRRTEGDLTVWPCASIEDAQAAEGQPLNFVVEHSTYPVRGVAGATGGLTLSYETEDGTASSADYTGTAQGSVTIPANTDTDDSTSSGTISVPTIEDTAVEGAETLRVILGGVSGVLRPRSTATGTILDKAPPPPPPPTPLPPPPPPPPPDEDEDGITDEIESGAPNDGDGNCDGIPDAEQSHVVSFPTAKDGRYVTLEAPRQARLSGVRSSRQPPRGYPPLPPEVTAPISFLGFHLGGVGRGGDATVSLYLSAGLEINSYWQYGPTRDHGEPHWQPFAYDGETGATFPEDQARRRRCWGRRIKLHYIDGERGDGDGRRNGVIESFGAPVLVVPALAPVSIDFPGEEGAVGVALHNPTNADNDVRLSVVDAGGETHGQVELAEALEEKGQLARMVCELIDCELESGASAVVARGRQGHLRSMFMVGTRDGRKLDGVSGGFETARRLWFPIVQSEGARATLLFVFNPTLVETGVTFSRYRNDGSLSASASREVAAGGFVMEPATGVFGGAEEGAGGYVEARGENKLLGFAFLRDEESFAALAAQVPRDFTEEESFHAPHFEMGAESRTTLYVLSALRNHTTRLRVRAFDEDGQPLGEAERELSRDGGSLLLVSDLDELLPLPASAQPEGRIEGYLQLDFSVTAGVLLHIARPRVLGAVEVVRGGSRTVLPLVGSRDIAERSFLQVAHSERPDSYMSTSLSILNPGPETAMVRLRVFDPAGRPSSPERIVSIVPGSRLSGSLEAEWLLDPRFTQAGGHLQVISDRPVISFALFTGRNGQYLSAIAARPGSP
ncbi:MAG: hypothetical protein OXK78_19350 [Caldilineaceae bacterium]|nr:hypothetical protein [Caldilineaceae bacterium]